jgi:thymidylate synthase
MAQDHNLVTEEKTRRALEQALAAFSARKTPQEIGYVPGRGVYEDAMADIYWNGTPKTDRTGTGTVSRFALQLRFDLQKGFPLITTKKVHYKSILFELFWMIRGMSNNNWLKKHGVSIWDEWAGEDGELGPVYGVQWRKWPDYQGGTIDQLGEAIKLLKKDPDSRRILVSAWNVAQLKQMALMPCHALFQFYVAGGALSCQLYQRSADWFLGVPFNIASYALLTHTVAQQCDLDVGEFVWAGGDCHLYSNHFTQAETQLGRTSFPYPTLKIMRKPDSIDEYEFQDFVFENYQHHAHIPAPVAK